MATLVDEQPRYLSPPFKRRVVALERSGVDLPWAANLLGRVGVHFHPVGDPARQTSDGEEDGEHVQRDAHRAVDDAAIEIDVWVELALDEVFVLEGSGFELLGNIEDRVADS